jgi:hypothetical protein
MHDRVDRAERGTTRANEFGRGAFPGEIAKTRLDASTGPRAFRRHRLQSLASSVVSPLPVQHQALIAGRKPARHRRSDAGAAAGDDCCSHCSFSRTLDLPTIGLPIPNANNGERGALQIGPMSSSMAIEQ